MRSTILTRTNLALYQFIIDFVINL